MPDIDKARARIGTLYCRARFTRVGQVAEVDHTTSLAALNSQELSHADPEDSVADDGHESQCSTKTLVR
jgi:hypothetical protein